MMRVQETLGFKTYAIVINKQELANRGHTESPREVAWEFLLHWLERLTTTTHATVMVVHDEGEGAVVRKIARKARRAGTAGSAFGTGHLNVPARLLVDDPISRDSRQSYFVQLADLSAYAAFRRIHARRQGSSRSCRRRCGTSSEQPYTPTRTTSPDLTIRATLPGSSRGLESE